MRMLKVTTALLATALVATPTWAGQFGDYTKQAMDYWAQLIRQRLDAAHGK